MDFRTTQDVTPQEQARCRHCNEALTIRYFSAGAGFPDSPNMVAVLPMCSCNRHVIPAAWREHYRSDVPVTAQQKAEMIPLEAGKCVQCHTRAAQAFEWIESHQFWSAWLGLCQHTVDFINITKPVSENDTPNPNLVTEPESAQQELGGL